MRVTLLDVAKKAQVAASTVSYAISGERPISQETREKVYQAAKALGYDKSPSYSKKISRNVVTLGLLMAPFHHQYLCSQVEFMDSLEKISKQNGFQLFLTLGGDHLEQITKLWELQLVDGFIVMEVQLNDARIQLLNRIGAPFVCIGHPYRSKNIAWVDFDFFGASQQAVSYLSSLGHTDIAFLGYCDEEITKKYGPAFRAKEGYLDNVSRLKLKSYFSTIPNSVGDYHRFLLHFFQENPKVTAVIVQDEQIFPFLISIQENAKSKNIRHISMLALAPSNYFTSSHSGLSFVEFPILKMCISAVSTITNLLCKLPSKTSRKIIFRTNIIERGSCKKIRVSGCQKPPR